MTETSVTDNKEVKNPVVEAKKKLVVADLSGAIMDQAIDTAEEKLTADKNEVKGVKGFFNKIWKHNLAREYYRQKETYIAKKEIVENQNLYDGEGKDVSAHNMAMKDIVDRFSSDYEETLHAEAGEKREILGNTDKDKEVKVKIDTLIKSYATGKIDENGFNEEKTRLFNEINGVSAKDVKKGVMYADNFLEMAKEIKQSIDHGEKMEELDMDFEVVVGKAKAGVRTEAQFKAIDKIVDKITSTKVGSMVNEVTMAAAVGAAYSIATGLSRRLASSKLFAWASFGGTAALAGGIAGFKESKRLEEERKTHFRDMAKDKKFDPDKAPRRKKMEEFRYETRTAQDLVHEAKTAIDDKDTKLTKDQFDVAVDKLAEIEARIKLSDRMKIDLISFSGATKVEGERLKLDLARAELKVSLRKRGADQGDVDGKIKKITEARMETLIKGDNGIEQKNQLFKKMKHKEVAKMVAKTVTSGLIIGGVTQEIGAFFKDDQKGFLEGLIKGRDPKANHFTPLEYARLYLSGKMPSHDLATTHEFTLGKNTTKLPEGVDFIKNSDGSYDLVKGGDVLGNDLTFDSNGNLSAATRAILQKNGIYFNIDSKSINSLITKEVTFGPKEWIAKNQSLFSSVKRVGWYDSENAIFDKNELVGQWGGIKGTGIDANGDFVFNVKQMLPDGSRSSSFSADALKAISEGKLKLLLSLSEDTQGQVIEIPIDANGNAIIDKLSEAGKTLFSVEGGKANFLGKYGEVAEIIDTNNGIDEVRILATKSVSRLISKEITVGPQEWIDKNPSLFSSIKRVGWYDNDTTVFDKNEIAGQWGGIKGTGIDANGDFVLNVKQMSSDGSYHDGFSVDAQKAISEGKLKLLLSLSRDTQSQVIEIPIDANGNAVIDKLSEAGKTLFSVENGKANFLGKFGEVAEMVGTNNGVDQVKLLATMGGEGLKTIKTIVGEVKDDRFLINMVGEGIDTIKTTVDENIINTFYETTIGVPLEYNLDVPWIFPLVGRNPLEKTNVETPYGLYTEKQSVDEKKEFDNKLSKTLKNNPEAVLDQYKETGDYIKTFEKKYKNQVEDLAGQLGKMDAQNKLSICIPVAGHAEGEKIYDSLKSYSTQNAGFEKFEVLLFVNRPEKDKKGNPTKWDKTLDEVERFKNDFPEVNIRVMQSVLAPSQANIGMIRKLLSDANLVRQHARGESAADLIMVSNDADNKGISPDYVKNFIDKFEKNKEVDGMLGQLDWDPESYVQYPAIHVGTRLFQYLGMLGRNRSGNMVSSGANFAYRSSIYAATGGYSQVSGAEDVKLGKAIKNARGGDVNRIKFAGGNSRVYTDSRRAIDVYEQFGLSPVEQWDKGFSVNDALRGTKVKKGEKINYSDPETLKKLKTDLEQVINRTLDVYENGEKLGKKHNLYGNALRYMGIKYELDDKGDIIITEMGELINGLKKYQEEGMALAAVKSGKKGATEDLAEIRKIRNELDKENREKTATEVNGELKEFYSKNSLDLDFGGEDLTNIDVIAGQKKTELGEYIMGDVLSEKIDGKVSLAVKKGKEKEVLVAKENSSDYMSKLPEEHVYPEGVISVEDYVKGKVNPELVVLPEEVVVKDGRTIRFYKAGNSDLEGYLRNNDKLSTKDAVSIMISIGDGIRQLNEAGVVYVDVAPSNIVLTRNGAKLIDLDGASIVNTDGYYTRKISGGNRFALAPELFKKGTPFNKTVDVYAAAATLYRIMTGNWPYNIEEKTRSLPVEEKREEYRKLHESGKINFPDSMQVELKNIIKKAMEPKSYDRYQSMDEFLNELLKFYKKV